VGQVVIQIAAARGLRTLNFVRGRYVSPLAHLICLTPFFHLRNDISKLKEHLQNIGATQVLTYEDLDDHRLRDKIRTWLDGKVNSTKWDFEMSYINPVGNSLGS